MRKTIVLAFLLALATPLAALAGQGDRPPEPDRITVQHILISFEGKSRGKKITRGELAARALAYELLEKAKAGEDFDAMVKEHTDDSHPGVYRMTNKGVDEGQGEYGRKKMVPCFGEVGFSLEVGEIGMADYHSQSCPFGYHIIKRLE
jgi:foldase protein PrsA